MNGATLQVTVLVDPDLYNELVKEGWSEDTIEQAIKDSITLTKEVPGAITFTPVSDIMSVDLQKYY